MKNVLTKLSYMAFGCLLTLIGYHIGNVDHNWADAQSDLSEQTVDEIRCRSLVIVDEDDTPRVTLDKGGMGVYNATGVLRASIFVEEMIDSGSVVVLGPGPPGGSAAILDVDVNGGRILLWNKFTDKPVLRAVITDKGEGAIVTRDIAADEDTAILGPKGKFSYTIRNIYVPRKKIVKALTADPGE